MNDNRKIKFRVWYSKENKMYYPKFYAFENDTITWDWNGGDFAKYSRFYQQFTGILDNQGKELYEEDIVSVYDPYNIFVVKFGKVIRDVLLYNHKTTFSHKKNYNKLELNSFYFESIYDKKAYFSITENEFGENDLKGTKIIGNTFENPELLKQLQLKL